MNVSIVMTFTGICISMHCKELCSSSLDVIALLNKKRRQTQTQTNNIIFLHIIAIDKDALQFERSYFSNLTFAYFLSKHPELHVNHFVVIFVPFMHYIMNPTSLLQVHCPNFRIPCFRSCCS